MSSFASNGSMASRRALLILNMQNEFLDQSTGRVVVTNPSNDGKLSLLQNVEKFLQTFRQHGGDVIWVRSEFKTWREFDNPQSGEHVLIAEDADENGVEENGGGGDRGAEKISGKPRQDSFVPQFDKDYRSLDHPKSLTDDFLSDYAEPQPCSPGSPGADWHPTVLRLMGSPSDRILTKTWYSAFKDTPLLQTLRGRFVTELYICGLMTNGCALATAADAAQHGFEVWALSDCLGYRSHEAHEQALLVMEDNYAVETTTSTDLIKSWEKKYKKSKGAAEVKLGAVAMPKEDLVKMLEGLKLPNDEAVDSEVNEDLEDFKPLQYRKAGERKKPSVGRTSKEAGSNGENSSKGQHVEGSGPRPKLKSRKSDSRGKRPREAALEIHGSPKVSSKTPSSESLKEPHAIEAPKAFSKTPSSKPLKESPAIEAPNVSSKTPSSKPLKESPAIEAPKDAPNETAKPKSTPVPTKKFDSKAPIVGVGDVIGEGDSYLVHEILSKELAEKAFENTLKEVAWRSMFHRGGEVPRLVAVEGEILEDGSFPIYRHPSDESPPLLPFSPTVSRIRDHVERVLKHPVNHVLIQHYRGGDDYISEHSDKTLDIVRGSKIVNVSLGAERTMVLRTKKDASNPPSTPSTESHEKFRAESSNAGLKRTTQRIPLPHNSMFVLGPESNKKWLHGIRQDRRERFLKTPSELAFNGERISLTFRLIGTFLSSDEKTIHGQGAVSKSPDEPRPVINGDSAATERLLEAFGSENHRSDFDWDVFYGTGFDVLHLKTPLVKLYCNPRDGIANLRARICLHEKGIDFVEEQLPEPSSDSSSTTGTTSGFLMLNPRGRTPILVDTDRERTTVHESLAILTYLEMYYPSPDNNTWLLPSLQERAAYARAIMRLYEADTLLEVFQAAQKKDIEKEMDVWERYLQRNRYVAGGEYSLADVAVFPVVEAVVGVYGAERWPMLEQWRGRMAERRSVIESRRARD
ncbi:hypothetical protein RUND412_002841 [Rhizina undulata]